MPNPYSDIAECVRRQTNKKLEQEMARVSKLTETDIARLVPTKADKEALAELMAIVRASSAEASRVADLQQNIQKFGTVVVRLLRTLV
jgi:hypothetical protein